MKTLERTEKAKARKRHKIVFTSDAEIEAVVRAKLGHSTKVIQRETGFSASQITYRLTKAKIADGLPKGQGYRSQWRDGTSDMARQIFAMVAPRLRRDTRKELPAKFITPPVEASAPPQKHEHRKNSKKALARNGQDRYLFTR